MNCSRCGADIGNGDVTRAATISTMDKDGFAILFWLGKLCGCERRTLTKGTLRAANDAGLLPELYPGA